MQHTQEEILNALQVIQDTCKEHNCKNCPFRANDDDNWVCIIDSRSPDTWKLNTAENWRAILS